MLKKEDWMDIKAQLERGFYQKDIANRLGVHPKTVSRAVARQGAPIGVRPNAHKSKLDEFKPFVDELLREGVWNAKVVLMECREKGYTGSYSVVRDYIHPKRPLRESKATVRYETEPGHQMQNDWGTVTVQVGGSSQKVHFTVNTLGYSRRFHFWCAEKEDAEHTYEGIIRAFEYFGGVPREVLVDNQKSLVIHHHIRDAVHFNERFIDLAGLYGFTPRACRPYRARTKGKDERMVGYIKGNFFVRYRRFDGFEHMNLLAEQWLKEEADQRIHGTVKEVVVQRFLREAPTLGALPAARYDTSYREHRMVHWDGYIDVQGNRYSVPSFLCGKQVTVRISLDGRLAVYAGDIKVADHVLRSAREGWGTVADHHHALWQHTFQVQRRDLSVYEEVGLCS